MSDSFKSRAAEDQFPATADRRTYYASVGGEQIRRVPLDV